MNWSDFKIVDPKFRRLNIPKVLINLPVKTDFTNMALTFGGN
jgi:hypothetical protein